MAALVAAAAMHFLFVQDLLTWVAFALLLVLALCFGLVGWQVMSILRTQVRRTLGLLPNEEDAGTSSRSRLAVGGGSARATSSRNPTRQTQ
jgi:hypothetical protein